MLFSCPCDDVMDTVVCTTTVSRRQPPKLRGRHNSLCSPLGFGWLSSSAQIGSRPEVPCSVLDLHIGFFSVCMIYVQRGDLYEAILTQLLYLFCSQRRARTLKEAVLPRGGRSSSSTSTMRSVQPTSARLSGHLGWACCPFLQPSVII